MCKSEEFLPRYLVIREGERTFSVQTLFMEQEEWFLAYYNREAAELFIERQGQRLTTTQVNDGYLLWLMLAGNPGIAGFIYNVIPGLEKLPLLAFHDYARREVFA